MLQLGQDQHYSQFHPQLQQSLSLLQDFALERLILGDAETQDLYSLSLSSG